MLRVWRVRSVESAGGPDVEEFSGESWFGREWPAVYGKIVAESAGGRLAT